MKNNLDDLEKLNDLLKKEIISEDEFKKAKDKILNNSNKCTTDNLFGLSENTYCFLIHISVLLGFINIILGLISPLILWTLNKEKNQRVDQNGKNVLNWILSFALYLVICIIIMIPFHGIMNFPMHFSTTFPVMISLFSRFFPITILMALNVIFILIGAIKASSGITWRYPLSIRFFKN